MGDETDETCLGTNKKKPGPDKSKARQVAEDAGMSRFKAHRARKIAQMPDEEFEELVEGDDPPSITELFNKAKETERNRQGRRLKRCPHCGESLLKENDPD